LDLSYLNLKGINFFNSDLRKTNLSHTNLTNSILRNASLLEVNLDAANLNKSDLSGSIYNLHAESYTIWSGLPDNPDIEDFADALVATVFPKGFDIQKEGIYCINNGEKLENIDLSNFSLDKIKFAGTTLKNANLKGADLSGSDLSYSSLEGANLQDTDLYLTCFTYADLRNTNLSGARIINTFLDGADLSGCDLSNANVDFRDWHRYTYTHSPIFYDKLTKFPNGFQPKEYNFKKSRFISPKREDIDSLKTPLNCGERKVLDFFDENLSEDWEIYIQPHLNGLRPDFVLLNPNIGIAIFEVKDWDLNAMLYRVKQIENNTELWAKKNGIDFQVKDNPIEKVALYKESIANLYCPEINILRGCLKS
jgi:uncharacterized protein YjbI with pentapeptide repeats